MNKIIPSAEQVAYLCKEFKHTENCDLAERLGWSERTIRRKAKELGLKKSRQFLANIQSEGRSFNQYQLRKQGKKANDGLMAHTFKKGHKFSPEVEARRVEGFNAYMAQKRLQHGTI